MVPLNLWLEQVNGQALRDAVESMAMLSASWPPPTSSSDMLFKNSASPYGRVVFYDYDEISYMTEVNFREIPPPRYPEDELASEPWYSVSPGDVFGRVPPQSAPTRALGHCLKRCMPTCCAPTTGAHCRCGLKTAMWKMSTPTGASSVLACAMAPTVDRIRRLRRHPARCADLPDGATLIRFRRALWGIFLFNPAIRQRHFLRRLDHQRAQLSHPIIGHTRDGA